jgi:phosphate transport system permease protein
MKAKNHKPGDAAGRLYAFVSISLTVAVCMYIILNVLYLGIDVISLDFLTKPPSASALDAKDGGILTPMVGTALLTLIGILIALPLSLSTAIYLC